jgi:hypothetical protein
MMGAIILSTVLGLLAGTGDTLARRRGRSWRWLP